MWGSLCAGSFLLGHESGHSIARPIACGNRVPPQRTVLRETSAPQACLHRRMTSVLLFR